MSRLKHPNTSPFYEWLDQDEIRDVLHRVIELPAGERLVLLKGLVPALVDTMGLEEVEDFMDELAAKARRYDEARRHAGEGRRRRRAPGELIGGATPAGHLHGREPRNPDRKGGRAAERDMEREIWRAAGLARPGGGRRLGTAVLIGAAVLGMAGALGLLAGRARPERGRGDGPRRRRGPAADRHRPTVEQDLVLADRNDRYAG